MSAILIDERVTHYEVVGRSRPISFLHGWVGAWRYWLPAMQSACHYDLLQRTEWHGFHVQHGFNGAIPSLIAHGQNHPAICIWENERYLSMPELVHQVMLQNPGHFPILDEGPRYYRRMSDFMELDSGESPRELQLKEEWKQRVCKRLSAYSTCKRTQYIVNFTL